MLAAERTAAASRMASALTDVIAVGCNTHDSAFRHGNMQAKPTSSPPEDPVACVIVIACAESADDLPASLRRCFTHELPLDAPDAGARKQLISVSATHDDIPCMTSWETHHACYDTVFGCTLLPFMVTALHRRSPRFS